MQHIKTIFVSLICICSISIVHAQTEFDSLINHYRKLSISAPVNTEKNMYSDSIRFVVREFLNSEHSFSQPLGKIPYIGDVYSPDGAFRLITWNITLTDGTYDYYCFIQMAPDKNQECIWYELIDHHKNIPRPETKSLNKDKWFGALYYTIIPFKSNKETYYVLLGWEGNNNYSNRKVLECLSFNREKEPVFVKTVFKTERFNKRRVVFEYSKEAYLMLRYNENLEQIIFNRLEPTKPELKGLYNFYQPTMTFDAYELHKGEWVMIQDVNPRNKKNDKEFHNPEDLKRPKN